MMMMMMSSKKVSELLNYFSNSSHTFLDGFLVSADQLITTLPTWGQEYKLSLELSFNEYASDEYAGILNFQPKKKHMYCGADIFCDRIPAVFGLHKQVNVYNGFLYSKDI